MPPKCIVHDCSASNRGTLEKELHFLKRLQHFSKILKRKSAQKEENFHVRGKITPPNSPLSAYHRSNNFHLAMLYNRKRGNQTKEDFQQSDINTPSDSTSPQSKNTKSFPLSPK
jgi:hypothetical protein